MLQVRAHLGRVPLMTTAFAVAMLGAHARQLRSPSHTADADPGRDQPWPAAH